MLKLREEKERTAHLAIRKASLPEKAVIPLSQHLGKMAQPIVKVGDSVRTGQLIATLEEKAVFAPIHSSISGKVASIEELPHPLLGRSKAIVIDSDGQDEKIEFRPNSLQAIEQLAPHDIRKVVFDCGIVGMGGAGFPAHLKLNPPKHVDSFILNGAECEPYLTADNRLMVEKAEEIILGLALMARCAGAKDIYVAIEDNKPEAIRTFRKELNRLRLPVRQAGIADCRLRVIKSQYPQGSEKQLIKSVLGREIPAGKFPFDEGVVVHNVATAYAVYEAVCLGKPLYERVITVTGGAIENPGNLLVRIGTTIKDLMDECGPVRGEPEKIVFGGPMMGLAQYSLQAPVIKITNGVIFLSEKEVAPAEEAFCLRCGRCIESCPLGLMPCMIALAAEKEKWDLAKSYGALECMECGSCSYVCPQRRNIVQQVKYAKMRLPK